MLFAQGRSKWRSRRRAEALARLLFFGITAARWERPGERVYLGR